MSRSTAASSSMILARRGNAISDLSQKRVSDGSMTLAQAESAGIYKINGAHQIGLATSTEVGLAPSRFPLRVVILPREDYEPSDNTVVACRYWKVVNAAGEEFSFSRKPIADDSAIKRLYEVYAELDDKLWDAVRIRASSSEKSAKKKGKGEASVTSEQVAAKVEALFPMLILPNPTTEQRAAMFTEVKSILEMNQVLGQVPKFKVAPDVFIEGRPAGKPFSTIKGIKASRVAILESAMNLKLNEAALTARNVGITSGVITLAAYAICTMFRFGLFENYEHKEFHTVYCTLEDENNVRVVSFEPAEGTNVESPVTLDEVHNLSDFKIDPTMVEYGALTVVISGLMHYLFNHTTGGTKCTGALMGLLGMYNFINASVADDMLEAITSVMYEALHPTNKRAIANLFFKNSGVTLHGRSESANKIEQFSLDTYANIRMNPHPAGSHKAFVCLQGLKRVLASGLGAFLPWADELQTCITTCGEVLNCGARAHMGAHYYTGESSRMQPASIDNWLPDIAQFVRVFHKGDSLTLSPHMAPEVAVKCDMTWSSVLAQVKANDVSSTNIDTIKDYLRSSGITHVTFNADDPASWGKTAELQKEAIRSIDAQFS